MTAAVSGTPLQSPFTFSYMRRGGKTAAAGTKKEEEEGAKDEAGSNTATAGASDASTNPAHPYENAIKIITTVSTVEGFWETYDYLKRPSDLPSTTDYHFFRGGIKPTWEDPSNAKGGKWIVRLPKGLASRYWEEIILALIGGQFSGVPDGEICGAVLSVRYSEDILGVWNRSSADRDTVERIRDAIKKILQLPSHANMEYKPHQNSIQDRSSFRNTQVWKPKSAGEGTSSGGGASIIRGSGRGSGRETRRSGSWGEREDGDRSSKAGGRDSGRAWRS